MRRAVPPSGTIDTRYSLDPFPPDVHIPDSLSILGCMHLGISALTLHIITRPALPHRARLLNSPTLKKSLEILPITTQSTERLGSSTPPPNTQHQKIISGIPDLLEICKHAVGLFAPISCSFCELFLAFIQLTIVSRAPQTWKSIAPVPTSQEFLDIVLSRTQRRLPTQIRAGFAISRIRGLLYLLY